MEDSLYRFSIKCLKIIGLYNKDIVLDLRDARSYTPIYFIGQNGSFKSTVIEIIYAIFASYDAPSIIKKYRIDYDLEYTIQGNKVHIIKHQSSYDLTVESVVSDNVHIKSANIDKVRHKLKERYLLPLRVISFYAGENDRIQKMSRIASRGYNVKLNKKINILIDSENEIAPFFLEKRYIHGDNNLIPLLLVKASSSRESAINVLKERCHVVSLYKISFDTDLVLKSSRKVLSVREAKDVLYSVFPETQDLIVFVEQSPKKEERDNPSENFSICYRFDEENSGFTDVYELYDFLASIFEGTIRTYMKTSGESNDIINDTQLSQGQRQWVKIIGLLSFVNDGNNLVLIDEPDAFMNPVWKYEFHKTLQTVLEGGAPGVNLIVTHDPLLINGVPKEQIRIFEKTDSEVLIQEPISDTYGLGIDGILRSSYYGLTTTVDQVTSEKYFRRMYLYSKAINNELSDRSEKRELFELTKELGSLPVFNSSIDYLYLDFLKAYEKLDLAKKEYLTPEEVNEKKEAIDGILRNLFMEH